MAGSPLEIEHISHNFPQQDVLRAETPHFASTASPQLRQCNSAAFHVTSRITRSLLLDVVNPSCEILNRRCTPHDYFPMGRESSKKKTTRLLHYSSTCHSRVRIKRVHAAANVTFITMALAYTLVH